MSKLRFWMALSLVVSFAVGGSFTPCLAGERPEYVQVLSGYMVDDDLSQKDDYEIVPFFFALGWSVTDWWRKQINPDLWGYLFFELEPFLNPVIGPETNLEFGVSFNLKWVPKKGVISPYIKLGTGPGYTTQHTLEQGSQWNFFSFVGLGVEFLVRKEKNVGFLVEYRYRHFSNGGLKKPNKGVNTQGVIAGVRWKF